MKDIQIGDIVNTPDNSVAKVTNKYYHSSKSIYKITLNDGREVLSCDEHLWSVIYDTTPKVVMLKELLQDFNNSTRKRFYLPLTKAIEETQKDYVLDPYLLGFLLGDGCLLDSRILFSTSDTEIIQKIADTLKDGYIISHISNYDYSIQKEHRNSFIPNDYLQACRELGLTNKKSYEKFIPESYLYGSIEQRLALLQGLMDSDGSSGNNIEFCSTSKQLAEQVRYLIWSLGGTASITSRDTSYSYKGKIKTGRTSYRVIPSRLPFAIKQNLFSLSRKRDLVTRGQYDDSNKIRIESIDYIGEEACYCIEINHPEHLYITDNFVVTHNTFLGMSLAFEQVLDPSTEYDYIGIVRSVVPTREMGFLKGDDKEKIAVYEAPYSSLCAELFGIPDAYDCLKNQGAVQFFSTSFIRGLTLNNCIIIVDEFENLSFHELDSIITRMGKNSKIIFCGDYTQSDLIKTNERNGCLDFMKILRDMKRFEFIEFGIEDIVRGETVRDYIVTKYKLGLHI